MLRKLWQTIAATVSAIGAPREIATHHELNVLVRDIEDLDPVVEFHVHIPPDGLVPCGTCGVRAARRGNHMSVHFPSLQSARPCPASWPPATTRSKT